MGIMGTELQSWFFPLQYFILVTTHGGQPLITAGFCYVLLGLFTWETAFLPNFTMSDILVESSRIYRGM